MLSLGITLVFSLAVAPTASGVAVAGVTCADEPSSHEAGWVVAPEAEPSDYATPVDVECPTPAPGGSALADATCDETPPPDLWYRISTAGAIEHATATLAAARRGHFGRSTSAAGPPPPDTRQVPPPDLQPLALCALPVLALSTFQSGVLLASDTPPARTLAPPDRPPRV